MNQVSYAIAFSTFVALSPIALAESQSAPEQTTSLVTLGGTADEKSTTTIDSALTDTAAKETLPLPPRLKVPMSTTITTMEGQRYPDLVLRVVDKSDRALDVGLLVIGALVGGFRLPVAKEEYRGTKVDSLYHPFHDGQFQKIANEIDTWYGREKTEKQLKNPIYIRPDTFSLVYADFDDEHPTYDLYFKTTVSRKNDSAGWFSSPTIVTCTDKFSTPPLTRSQWEADNYAAVKARGTEHVQHCLKQVAVAFDDLLKD